MNFYTKRFYEVVIVVVVVVFFLQWQANKQQAESNNERSLQAATILNQAMWDKFGPGSRDAYKKVLPNGMMNLDEYADLSYSNETIDAADAAGVIEGILGIDEAPDWFHERLDKVDDYVKEIDKAVEQGPFLASPDEVGFATAHQVTPNFLHLQKGAESLRHYAMKQWHRGERIEAIQTTQRIFKLCDSLRYDPSLITHLIRVAVYDIGLNGMERFLWLEPTMDELKEMQTALLSSDLEGWVYPDYVESILWNQFYAKNMDHFAATLLLMKSEKNNTDVEEALREAGLLPRFQLSESEILSIVNKWTTVPAMKKRAEHLTGSLFENHTFLSPEQAKQLPRLYFVASQYQYTPFLGTWGNAFIRFDNVRNKMILQRIAVWVRLYKEEHGNFPNMGQIQTFVNETTPDYDFNVFHYLTDPGQFGMVKNAFQQIHLTGNHVKKVNYAVPGLDQWDGRKLHYQLDYYPGDPITGISKMYPDFDAGMIKTRIKGIVSEQYVEATRAELIDWTRNIFEAFKPIVKSTTLTYFDRTEMNLLRNQEYSGLSPEDINNLPSNSGGYGYGVCMYGMRLYDGDNPYLENGSKSNINTEYMDKKYPFFLTVELDLPKESYWLVHPGPNDIFDSHPIPLYYDPSNGSNSAGNLYQFIGWK